MFIEPIVDIDGRDIYAGDRYYNVEDLIISSETMDDLGEYLEENMSFTCVCCEEKFDSINYAPYKRVFNIDGETYCEDCIEDLVQEYGGDW